MVKDYKDLQMVTYIKVAIRMGNLLVMGNISGTTEAILKVLSRLV